MIDGGRNTHQGGSQAVCGPRVTCVYRLPSLGVVRADRGPDYLCSVRTKRSGGALRVGVIGHLRFPISQPFAGGLEAATHALVERLAARGHDVTLFAAPGSVPDLPVRLVTPRQGRGPTVRQLLAVCESVALDAEEDNDE